MAKATARRHFHRARRYDLENNDIRSLRVVRKPESDREYFETEVLNISETGLAFYQRMDKCPSIGEILALEFHAPGGDKIAWYGKVVRIELPDERAAWKSYSKRAVVAVNFEKLPARFRRELTVGLDLRFYQLEQRRKQDRAKYFANWVVRNWIKIAVYILCTILTGYGLYLVSRPTPGYNSRDPSVWGERKW